jgi:outer membrane protein assembly factor BamB
MLNKKTLAILTLTMLIIATAIPFTFLHTVSAQTSSMKTYAYIGATPNPVGVSQEVLLHIGITRELTNVAMGYDGLTITILRPDNTTETISNIRTDSTGGTGIVYVPKMVGNYTLQTHFPEQVTSTTKMATGATAGTKLLASDSEKQTLVVQQDPMTFHPGTPLPTEYWTRPINAQFREWYTVSGSWLSPGSTIGVPAIYNQAPETPHVLWTKPLTVGGLVGGELGLVGSGPTSIAFNNGDAYQGLWSSRVIIAGILIYTYHTGARPLEYTAMDLRTGEELWTKTFLDNRTISTAQLFYWQSYNSQGAWPYLWVTVGTDWYAFNPFDAKLRFIITNVTTGTNVVGQRGEIYRYNVNLATGRMTLWNMSALISMAGGFGSNNYPGPTGTYNASATVSTTNSTLTTAAQRAWALNISIPTGLPGSVRAVAIGDRVVGSSLNATDVVLWAFSLKQGQEGTLLYKKVWKAPSDWLLGNQTLSWGATSLKENAAVVWSKEERRHYGFSLETGDYLWVTDSQHYLDIYDAGRTLYEGKLFSVGQAGIVYCFDLKTGKTLWTYKGHDPYNEVLWSDTWPVDQYFPCEDKIYFFQQEHSANQPLPRGAAAYCLNITTGEVVWRVDGLVRDAHWGSEAIMGDSVIVIPNTYDQLMYAMGKGPSAITISVGPKSAALGEDVIIEGTVTDISPGTEQAGITLRFPNGVPAVSDESQGEWMKYVYNQFPKPLDVTGVEVTISVLDANGNYREIGKTTSDSNGFYSFDWTPDIPGKYTVYASFTGSKAMYPSNAETAFKINPASETPTPQPTQQSSMADLYFVPAIAGLFVFVAIIGALTILLLRKRP